MQKFEFLRQPLLGELAMSWREKERREKVNDYSGTIVSERRRWRTHTLGPIVAYGCQTLSAQRRSDQNSGHLRLCQQPRAAHALRSDQDI